MRRLLTLALAFVAVPAAAQVTQPPQAGGASSSVIVCQTSTTSADLVNTTVETQFSNGSCTIPANLVGPNSIVMIETFTTHTSSANAKTIRFKIGGNIVLVLAPTTSSWQRSQRYIYATGAGAQLAANQSTNDVQTQGNSAAAQSFAFDFTTAQTVTVTGQLATSTENFVLRALRVVIYNPAN